MDRQVRRRSLWFKTCSPSMMVAALVTLIVLSVFSLLGWKAWEAREAVLARTDDNSRNLAHSLARNASRTFEAADIILTGIVERLQHDGFRPDAAQRLNEVLAMRVRASTQIRELVVLDTRGRWAFSSLPDLPTHENGDRDYFIFHRDHPDTALRVNGPLKSRLTDRWSILLTRRVNALDGSFAGVVVAAIDLDHFQRFYESFEAGWKGSISLYLQDGTLLVRHPFDAEIIGRKLSNSPLFNLSATEAAGHSRMVSSFDHVVKRMAFERLADYPILVNVALAEEEILAGWRSNLRSDLTVASLLSIVFATMGTILAIQFRHRAKVEASLRDSEARYRLLADNAGDVVVRLGLDGVRQYVSPAMQDILGWIPDELIGTCIFHLAHPGHREDLQTVIEAMAQGQEHARLITQIRRKDGAYVWIETSFKLVRDADTGAPSGIVALARDISQRKAVEQELQAANARLQTLAATDPLTELANRRTFDVALERECRRASRTQHPLSVLFIDIDKFKNYNDHYGHQAGDKCLRKVADVLTQAFRRPGDLAARIGGEEFAVILPDTDEQGATLVAENMRCMLTTLGIENKGTAAGVVTISTGVASAIPSQHEDGSELVRAADRALYEAKKSGRNKVVRLSEIADVRLKVA